MRLNMDDGCEIASRYFHSSDVYKSLGDDIKKKIILSSTVGKKEVKCVFYIPGARPELGQNLMILAIDRSDGSVREIHEDEFFDDV